MTIYIFWRFKAKRTSDSNSAHHLTSYCTSHNWFWRFCIIFYFSLPFPSLKPSKLIIIELFRLWEYEKTIYHGQNRLGAYIKTFFVGKRPRQLPTSECKPKKYFFKIALNRVLTLPNARSRREVSKSSGITETENKKHIRGDKTLIM